MDRPNAWKSYKKTELKKVEALADLYKDFVKEYCEKMDWSDKDYMAIIKNIPLFDRIYAYLDIDKKSDFALTKTKIDSCLKLLLDMGLNSSVSEEDVFVTIEEGILNEIHKKEFIEDVDSVLRDTRCRQIIHERYGLDGDRFKCLDELSKDHNVQRERIRQIEVHCLKRLGHNKNIKKYKGESF